MIKLGNLLFHNRNWLFPLFYIILFVPSPEVFKSPVTAMLTGFGITLLGQLIRIVTIGLVYIIRGGKNRTVYADNLVTTGIFSHCRNPLYAGNILILAGLGVASNSIIFITIATPLFIFFYQAIVRAEENFLQNKFGQEFTDYCSKVNRWIPNLAGIAKTIDGMEFKWKRVIIREYTSTYIWMSGAVLIVMKNFYNHDNRFDFQKNTQTFIIILIGLLLLYLFTRYLKKSKTLTSD
jgi:protein-S-isoprenylcysteine O-methyltransferase Ste14